MSEISLTTYSLVTAKRILERFNFQLDDNELQQALTDNQSFYHRILRCPSDNVLNGIILEQAKSYQLYAQKLLIDYFLSEEIGKQEDSPGSDNRYNLQEAHESLVKLNETFYALELEHEKLIGLTQEKTMVLVKAPVKTYEDLELQHQYILALREQLKTYRNDFYAILLKINEFVRLLPDYKLDEVKALENREALYFDSSLE